MGTLSRIALGVLAISFMTFVAFFGRLPALRGTPIAWLHRAIWVYIPNGILAVDNRLTSGRLTSGLGRLGNRILYGRHPTILIFFVLLLAGGEFMYLPGAWPKLSPFHKFMGAISIVLPYVFLYLAAFSDPGGVTSGTLARYMSHYPYDFTLFHPGQVCRTCNLLKPARSKHCSVCNRCIHKMDHHCVFINNCVGYGNQHWFILLLLSTALLTAYGSALGWSIITQRIRIAYRRPEFSLWKPATPYSWHNYLILLTVGIQDDVGVGSVTLLTMMTSPLVWGLLIYHIYLIWCGTTTNESMKWQDWKMEMDEGCAFKRGLPSGRVKDPRSEATWTRWPVEPVQVMVRTESGNPPSLDSPNGQGEWERVWRLADVENLYDIGFWDNLTDVFFYDYSFRRTDGSDTDSDSDDSSNSGKSGRGKERPRRADVERGRSKTKRLGGGKGKGKNKRIGKKPKAPAVASVVNAAT